MSPKSTLAVEKSQIEKPKTYATKKGRSLSEIIENYLKAITTDTDQNEIELSPVVKSLIGSFKMPANFDYNKELIDASFEKYLKS